jgi:hypothetical protein
MIRSDVSFVIRTASLRCPWFIRIQAVTVPLILRFRKSQQPLLASEFQSSSLAPFDFN